MSRSAVLTLTICGSAWAVGSDETSNQVLERQTELFVDIVDPATETIVWTSDDASVEVFDPSGASVDDLDDGAIHAPTMSGAYRLALSDDASDWDVEVTGATAGLGRVWSTQWFFNGGAFSEASAMNSSMYVVVDGGAPGLDGVVEWRPEGWAGFAWDMSANKAGVIGANGRSVDADTGFRVPQYAIYILPPQTASYTLATPTIATPTFAAGPLGCSAVSPGTLSGLFSFESSVDGTVHATCDLDRDGVIDITSDADLHLISDAQVGLNITPWDGTDNLGDPVASGLYTCEIWLTVGEFHYVAEDVETSYAGFRLFSVDGLGLRTGLDLFWNDTDVQGAAVPMPNGRVRPRGLRSRRGVFRPRRRPHRGQHQRPQLGTVRRRRRRQRRQPVDGHLHLVAPRRVAAAVHRRIRRHRRHRQRRP